MRKWHEKLGQTLVPAYVIIMNFTGRQEPLPSVRFVSFLHLIAAAHVPR